MKSDEPVAETMDRYTQNHRLQNHQKNVIIDVCVNGNIGDYLNRMGYNVFYITDTDPMMEDDKIKEMGYDMDAIIITADKRGFRNYENAVLTKSWSSPESVYEKVSLLSSDSNTPEP